MNKVEGDLLQTMQLTALADSCAISWREASYKCGISCADPLKGVASCNECRSRRERHFVLLLLHEYNQQRCKTKIPRFAGHSFVWRWGRDSNPRYSFPYVSLANWSFRPLRHLTNLFLSLPTSKLYSPFLGTANIAIQVTRQKNN